MAHRTLAFLALAVVLGGWTQSASAQWWNNGWGNNYPQNFSSTPAEGYYRGMGALVQSQGAANLMNSMAAQNLEAARSMELDNRLKGTQTYFEMRKINYEARQAERARLKPQSGSEMPHRDGPPRASASQIDPHTGQIYWPGILAASQYDQARQIVEGEFAQRAQLGQLTGDSYIKVQNIISEWLANLKANIRQIKPSDYVQATKFLEMLSYESQMPNG